MNTTNNTNKEFLTKSVLRNYAENSYSKGNRKRLAIIRKENNEFPIIYIGAGTCGLGAGADKTIQATKKYLNERGLYAEIVEIGCIGLCSSEPLLDVQLPGFNRISFENVTEEKVESILDTVFSGKYTRARCPGTISLTRLQNMGKHSIY